MLWAADQMCNGIKFFEGQFACWLRMGSIEFLSWSVWHVGIRVQVIITRYFQVHHGASRRVHDHEYLHAFMRHPRIGLTICDVTSLDHGKECHKVRLAVGIKSCPVSYGFLEFNLFAGSPEKHASLR